MILRTFFQFVILVIDLTFRTFTIRLCLLGGIYRFRNMGQRDHSPTLVRNRLPR